MAFCRWRQVAAASQLALALVGCAAATPPAEPEVTTVPTVQVPESLGPSDEPEPTGEPEPADEARSLPLTVTEMDLEGVPPSRSTRGGGGDGSSQPRPVTIVKARSAFRDGMVAYKQGDYAGARKHFEAAYGLMPRDPMLFNLARTALKQGDHAAACRYYGQWRATPKGKTAPPHPELDRACP